MPEIVAIHCMRMDIVILSVGAWVGVMCAVVFVVASPKATIRILETLKIYERGKLWSDTRTYVDGAGYYRNRKCYLFRMSNGQERFENARVFGWMTLICIGSGLLISTIVIFLSK